MAKTKPSKPKMVPIELAKLVEDLSMYPRNTISDTHVHDLVRALQAGVVLPPIIVDEQSLRIVDGVHRRRAFLKHFGADDREEVEMRTYASEADLFLDAVNLNAAHGRKLDRHDQTRVILRLRELAVSDVQIGAALHIPADDILRLGVRIIHDEAGASVPQKRGLEHLRGQTLNSAQVDAMKSVRSAEAGRLALELTRLLTTGLVDLQDDQIVSRLKQLQKALSEALAVELAEV